MNYAEALDYLNSQIWSGTVLGLNRTRELLDRVGRPQDGLKFVHVAGTNGKGSTCAMLAAVLQNAGYKTGMYPSPFIENFRERIQINGELIPEEALARLTTVVAGAADSMTEHPTHFELITAVGMLYFAEQSTDIVVLEVGLGGIYDSTNVIDAPVAAVITNIGYDHTEYLGSTLPEIAWNKAGIIKPGSRVISYDNIPEVIRVIRDACDICGDGLRTADFSKLVSISCDLDGQVMSYKGRTYRLSLIGVNQMRNCAVVLETIEALRESGFAIPEEAVERGLSGVHWPARFEVLSHEPLFILDGGHNPQCAEALRTNLETYLPGRKFFCIIGMLADKDYRETVRIIAPFISHAVTVTPDSPRALKAEALAEVIRAEGIPAEVCDDPDTCIQKYIQQGEDTISFGSLYLAGMIRPAFRRNTAAAAQ